MITSSLRKLVSAVLLFAAGSLLATPINFTFSGTIYGSLNGTSLSGQVLSIYLSADTDNVNTTAFGINTPIYQGLTGSFTLGSSAGTFNDSMSVFNNKTNSIIGVATTTKYDIVDFSSTLLSSYSLTTPFALSSDDITGVSALWQFSDVATSLGLLTVTELLSPSMSATYGATPVPAPVPEPSTYGLLGAGSLALFGFARRFRRKSV